jgi:MoaA/NifB/PqqE/SkfB family radical SAM enzyme
MDFKKVWQAKVDEEGRLLLSPEFVSHCGLKPGVEVRIEEGVYGLRLNRPVTHLAKVYIEPTNACNLECRTCIRNVWDEPIGQMDGKTFDCIMEGLKAFSPRPAVFLGGFGEPLFHPGIVDMVARVKALGITVELITNGTLLTQEMSGRLIEAGLDMLWVSLDGSTPESYADVRLGAALPEVLANLKRFRDLRMEAQLLKPEIGIVFVAMKRNIHDLPSLLQIGSRLDVARFLVTNVLPYTEELRREILYSQALMDMIYQPPLLVPHVKLPKIDVDQIAWKSLYEALCSEGQSVSIGDSILGEESDLCPFIKSGATAISWEGNLSPCLPLMHTYFSFLDERRRASRRHVVGNIVERSLHDLWNTPEYMALRERVQAFTFSHCVFCAGCELSWANEEDCRGNTFPTCGGCLWAQGVIQCP